jgi:hypothetical protein
MAHRARRWFGRPYTPRREEVRHRVPRHEHVLGGDDDALTDPNQLSRLEEEI